MVIKLFLDLQMWAEFEWENKLSVNTNVTDLREYLSHLLSATNMKCLTPEKVRLEHQVAYGFKNQLCCRL